MSGVRVDISQSLDGFVEGPDPTLDDPLGIGGELLHEWVLALAAWQEQHGRTSGETGAEDDMMRAHIARTGATIMGRRMFSGGSGPWDGDPNANGWWGDEPPFRHPVFVLTHHEREPLTLGATTFTFVTEGIESALGQARAAAGERDVHVAGGGEAVQQYVDAGLVDELTVHVAPVMLGGGTRLFGDKGPLRRLECTGVRQGARAVHLSYRAT